MTDGLRSGRRVGDAAAAWWEAAAAGGRRLGHGRPPPAAAASPMRPPQGGDAAAAAAAASPPNSETRHVDRPGRCPRRRIYLKLGMHKGFVITHRPRAKKGAVAG